MKINYKNYYVFLNNIDSFLRYKKYPSNTIYHLIHDQKIKLNGKIIMHRYQKIKFLDKIEVTLLNEDNTLESFCQPLDILYEDEYILIVNKEKGEDIEPVRYHFNDTLANKISNYYLKNGIKAKVHLVNRLDKMTSGIVVLAKNAYIQHLFSFTKIKKIYSASVSGKTHKYQTIKCFIKKDEKGVKRSVDAQGKLSITKITRLSFKNNVSRLKIRLLTGRTHQIRVSLNHIGHPLIGDALYFNGVTSYDDFDLMASSINFKHPILKKRIYVRIIDK